MINELFVYDRDNSLFKEVLKQSKSIKGRYHVSPNYGHDLNTNNLEAFIKDPAYGLTDVKTKYPLCVCITPKSRVVKLNGQPWEEFVFNLFFVCTANTQSNQLKAIDKASITSAQRPQDDWSEMKEAAISFITMLQRVINSKTFSDGTKLRAVVNIDNDRLVVGRLTKFNNDKLNGVSLSFLTYIFTDACSIRDYASDAIDNIIIPQL